MTCLTEKEKISQSARNKERERKYFEGTSTFVLTLTELGATDRHKERGRNRPYWMSVSSTLGRSDLRKPIVQFREKKKTRPAHPFSRSA